jgi:hypothetical protein
MKSPDLRALFTRGARKAATAATNCAAVRSNWRGGKSHRTHRCTPRRGRRKADQRDLARRGEAYGLSRHPQPQVDVEDTGAVAIRATRKPSHEVSERGCAPATQRHRELSTVGVPREHERNAEPRSLPGVGPVRQSGWAHPGGVACSSSSWSQCAMGQSMPRSSGPMM